MRLFIILASLPILAQQIPPSPPAVNSSSVPQVAGLKVVAITQPSAPTVTPTCTGTCATSYSYVVEAYTQFGSLHTQGSIAGSTSAQAATLDSAHYNTVAMVAVSNSAYCKVFRSVGGSTQGVIATVACGASVSDNGIAGDSTSADTANTTGALVAASTQSAAYSTTSNCSSTASPAVCGSASSGSAVIAAASTSVTVNTTAVTANSQIQVTEDESLGTRLSVTCNTQALTSLGTPRVTARIAATSFSVSIDSAPTSTPLCFNYLIVN